MPCNSSYMDATRGEIELSRVACLLDELAGKPFTSSHWQGYHPDAYGRQVGGERADKMVNALCKVLQSIDVTKHSLEMQMWWRDHQAADKARLQSESEAAKTEADKAALIAKLTPYERKLLGIT